MNRLQDAIMRSIVFEASGARAVMEKEIERLNRETEEKRLANLKEVRRLLAEEKADPHPIPEVIAAYTKLLDDLENRAPGGSLSSP